MDIGKLTGKIPKWFHQYRYPLLILLVGLVLLTIPGRKSSNIQSETEVTTESAQPDTSQQLTQILGQIEGVGKVKVMLSVSVGEKIFYHSDEDSDTAQGTSSVHKDTVIITDAQRNQSPLISQVIPAKYQGAVVVCQGADNPGIKWAVVEAVSKATGLGADQISVLKMK